MDMDIDMCFMFSEGFSNEQHEGAISKYLSVLDSTGSNEVEADSDDATSQYRNIEGKEGSSQFEGVVSLKNDHWGAQIWLGNFKTREEALMAYHTAHVKFTGQDDQINFPFTETEKLFLDFFTPDEVLCLMEDHNYDRELYKHMDYNTHRRHHEDMIPGGPMIMNSHERIIVDHNTDQKPSNHLHGSAQLGKRKAMEDESENKSDDIVKLFGIAIGTKPKAKKGMGIQIDPERKRIARWRSRN
ncbi:AP2/ERF and B3 domain-containing transcription repressor TEM1-like [Cryptomeria japonica]|uniref:AP2/ERF and B3 domain-containing transcription repressor TEM1-like n=1 Tax=Cryptomeria japonica TaxID=3369 RepID=UPI0027D9DFC8|nr:AP2/ERF and B3 domain-containing transcription repressor TEM1-like [Cryptomeria japonica]